MLSSGVARLSAALFTSQIRLQKFKMKEDHVSCLFKDIRINKAFEERNQSLTNWNGSCFSLSIMSLTFFCLSPPFFHYITTWLRSHRCASDTQIRTTSQRYAVKKEDPV